MVINFDPTPPAAKAPAPASPSLLDTVKNGIKNFFSPTEPAPKPINFDPPALPRLDANLTKAPTPSLDTQTSTQAIPTKDTGGYGKLFFDPVPVRIPFGTADQTGDVKGLVQAGAVGFMSRLIETIPKVITQGVENAKSNASIVGGGTDTGTKLFFDPARLGLPTDPENKVYSTGTKLSEDFNARMDKSPATPKYNALLSIVNGPIQDAFDAEFAGSLVSGAATKVLKATGASRESLDALARLDINPKEFHNLAEQDAREMVTTQAKERIQAVLEKYKGQMSKGAAVPQKAIDEINAIGRDVGQVGHSYFNAPTKDLGPIGDSIRDLADQLTRPLDQVGKTAPLHFENPDAEKLPGYRRAPGQAPAFGLSTEEVEPVGHGKSSSNVPVEKPVEPQKSNDLQRYRSKGEPLEDIVYHGTKAPITSLKEADVLQYGKPNALYGQGLYLTDNRDVAKGYSTTKGRSGSGRVLTGKIKPGIKLLNLDDNLSSEERQIIEHHANIGNESGRPIKLNGSTGDVLMRQFMESLHGMPLHEGQEIVESLQSNLEDLGYDGFRHTGGKMTGGVPSKISILWDGGKKNAIDKVEPIQDSDNISHQALTDRITEYQGLPIGEHINNPTAKIPVGDKYQISNRALKHFVEVRTAQGAPIGHAVDNLEDALMKPQLNMVDPQNPERTVRGITVPSSKPNKTKGLVAILDKNNEIVSIHFKDDRQFRKLLSSEKNTLSPAGGTASLARKPGIPSSFSPEGDLAASRISALRQDSKSSSTESIPNKANTTQVAPVDNPKIQGKVNQLHAQIQRVSASLRAYEANPEAHIKAYSEDRKPIYLRKIDELNDRINKLTNPEPKTQPKSEPKTPAESRPPTDKELRLYELALEREHIQDVLSTHPAKPLLKHVSSLTGELPEVAGNTTASGRRIGKESYFRKHGDNIVKELDVPYHTVEDADAGIADFRKAQQRQKQISQEYATARKAVAEERAAAKDTRSLNAFMNRSTKLTEDELAERKQLEKEANERRNLRAGYHEEVIASNAGVLPPAVRGGLRAPEVDWRAVKDIAAIRLSFDTAERNFEKVTTPEQAKVLNDFTVEATRANELERTKFVNDLRKEVRAKMKELGIKRGSDEDKLVQLFAENKVTITELRDLSPKKWTQIQSAADYGRKLYDNLLGEWNARRRVYDYPAVPKRSNYFRHFTDINQWTQSYGFLEADSQLPTEIAGITSTFRPGKRFSNAELKRTGDKTSYSFIGGLDNYLDTMSNQAFHIDSIQRGRAVTKYIREVAVASRDIPPPGEVTPQPLQLPNLVSNLTEWTNLVAGKAAQWDRATESVVGRPVLKFLQKITGSFGKNVIGGNISAAITHSIPVTFNLATFGKLAATKGLLMTLSTPLRPKSSFFSIDGVESSFLTRRFPEQRILPTKFDKATETLGFVFKTVDQFISRLAVTTRYHENIGNGLTPHEAMKEADNYAQRVIGDRSIGNLPNALNTRSLSFITQFQVEINDNLRVLLHDVPIWAKGSKWKIASMLVQFAIYSYLFNLLWKKVKGTGKGLDPINWGLTVAGLNEESAGLPFGSRAKMAGSEILGEMPFSSIVTGDFPLKGVLTPAGKAVGAAVSGDPVEALKQTGEFAAEIASPIGGGAQVLKSIKGGLAIKKGYTTTAAGKINGLVEKTPENYAKALLFGPTALNAAHSGTVNELFNRVAAQKLNGSDLVQQAETLDDELKKMAPKDASAKASAIAKSDPKLFAKLKTVVQERKAGLTQEERLIKQLGVANNERAIYIDETVMKITDADSKVQAKKRADYFNNLVEKKIATPEVIQEIKTLHANGGKPPVIKEGAETSDDSLIGRVATYAKAIGVDPVTAFNRIFTGQKIKRVANDAVVVERMSLKDSEAEAHAQLSATTTPNLTRGDVKLDHTIPLELGGSNNKDNLRLVTTAEWKSYSPIENLLGKALAEKKISRSKAQELITKFKKGTFTAEQVRSAIPQ